MPAPAPKIALIRGARRLSGRCRTRYLGVRASRKPESVDPPSLAQIGSHVLASIFTDALGTDLEKVRLVNIAVRQIEPARLAASPMPLRDIAMLVLTPSVPLETLAHEYRDNLPRSLRFALRGIGGTRAGGEGLLSYLLFDSGFCSALIELGYRDAQAKQAELKKLLS